MAFEVRGPLVHEHVVRVARSAPTSPAVRGNGPALTYGELCAAGSRLAHRLVRAGVGPDTVVALLLPRTTDWVVAVFAVLQAGAAYLPLDPALPTARLARLTADARPVVVLTDAAHVHRVPSPSGQVVRVDDPELAELPDQPVERRVTADHLAYVLYTSGSTGVPKGVLQTHRTLVHLVEGLAALGISDTRATTLQYAPASFDVSIQELATTWRTGGELVLISAEQRSDPEQVLDHLQRYGVERLFVPPAMLYLLAETWGRERRWELPRLREIVSAGEALALTRPLLALVGDRIRLVNEYGPTETHVATAHVVRDLVPGALPPIGRPLDGFRLRVVGPDGAEGVEGELWIAGPGVARGYLNRPDETAARFVGEGDDRAYRTGDRVRVRQDGELTYLGRMDDQVKIRGYRVEPGEIEQVLRRHLGVSDAVVAAPADRHGQRTLVAWFVGSATVPAVRAHLQAELPDYLVPRLVQVDQLPLGEHGKVDRSRLAELAGAAAEAPATPDEVALHAIWCEILGRASVGVTEEFLAAGGDSLKAVRLVAAIEVGLGRRLSLGALDQAPTIRALAASFAERGEPPVRLPPLTVDAERRFEPFGLTDVQRAYWLGRGQETLGGVGTHTYAELSVPGLDLRAFEVAWNRVVARHDLLRAVVTDDGQQRVLPTVPWYPVAERDLRGASPVEQDRALDEARDALSHQLFTGSDWPMFEVRVTALDDRSVVHLSLDALVLDLSSMNLISRELSALYLDPSAELPPLAVAYRDYVAAVRAIEQTALYTRSRAYWTDRLDTLPGPPELPLARDPATVARSRFERHTARLDPERWARLRTEAARLRLSPTLVVAGCFAEVLAGWSAAPRFALNFTLFHRIPLHPDVAGLVGDFTSLTLLEVDRSAVRPFWARLQDLQRRMWSDLEHRWFGGVEVQRALATRRGFPVVFTSALGLDDGAPPAPFDLYPAVRLTQTPQVWLDCLVGEVGGALVCHWDVVTALFPAGLPARMLGAFQSLLAQVADRPEILEQAVPDVVPPGDRQLVDATNRTEASIPVGPVHDPLLEQVRRRPDHVAIHAPDRAVTYGELGRASAALAERLVAGGARPGQPIAVVMDKGWEQVVAAVAVTRSGAPYLPIDASLPPARIAQLLELGGVEQVLTAPGAAVAGRACVEVDPSWLSAPAATGALPTVADTDLAYVIFTSGSTGTPKGVMIDHRGASNTVLDLNARFGVGPTDAVLGLSSLSFDLSVYDVFGVLGAGGTLVLPRPSEARDPDAWLRWIDARGVTLWNTVPALMQMVVEVAETRGARLPLRLVWLSGDWIPVDLPERIRRLAPDATVVSLGGATEASIWSIAHRIDAVDRGRPSIPYGFPLANQRFYVLRADLDLAPVWAVGELYIGGTGLAVGYWGDPVQTAERFVVHPTTGERLYRTGDLGRWWPDGSIEFLGRTDLQVKVGGHRIELGEIEAALLAHPAVREAAVAAPRVGGALQLAGFVALQPEWADETDPVPGDAVCVDPADRALFTLRRPGVRVDLVDLPTLPWSGGGALERSVGPGRFAERVGAAQVAAAEVEEVLDALCPRNLGGPLPKAFYPSAGSLYPVQFYLAVGAGAVDGWDAGTWWLDPANRALVRTGPCPTPGLRLHLVADRAAIEPMYGHLGLGFAEIEAGHAAQLVASVAPPGLGVRLGPPDPGLSHHVRATPHHVALATLELGRVDVSHEPRQPLSVVARKSYRVFDPAPVPEAAVRALIGADEALRIVRAGRIDGVAGGVHPASGWVAAPDDDGAAILAALGPVGAGAAFALVTDAGLGAGVTAQRWMHRATALGIGLCALGGIPGHEHRYFVVGGRVSSAQLAALPTPSADRWRAELFAHLERSLPEHLVPKTLRRLDHLPLSANGKVDRSALPSPDGSGAAPRRPLTGDERTLVRAVGQVLGLADPNPDASFFEIGGNSLSAVKLMLHLRDHERLELPLREIFRRPVLRELAAFLPTCRAPGPAARPIAPRLTDAPDEEML